MNDAVAILYHALAGLLLLFAPGAVAFRRTAKPFPPEARPALYFAGSLGLAAPAAVAAPAFGLSLGGFGIAAAATTAIAALWSLRGDTHEPPTDENDTPSVALRALVWLAAGGVALLALSTAASGSIDRWWYLAYIASFADSGSLAAADPMFGTAAVAPRFEGNVFLSMVALWSWVAGAPPVDLFDGAGPLLTAPLCVSAAAALGFAVDGRRRGAMCAGVAAALLVAGGSVLPGAARSMEDKLLAAAVVMPAALAATAALARSGFASGLLLAVASAAALAALHPLVCAMGAAIAIVYLLLCTAARLDRASRAAAAPAVAAWTAALALAVSQGTSAASWWAQIGAGAGSADHPVDRVHAGRERLAPLWGEDWIVDPGLLLNPVTIAGLLGLLAIGVRSRRERLFAGPASAAALAFCFVPPLAALAGAWISPWMVHRLLWAVPFAVLAGWLIDALSKRRDSVAAALCVLLAAVSAPAILDGYSDRMSARAGLAWRPNGAAELGNTIAAVRAETPQSAVIAAPPELSERLAGLTARRTLAASERATLVMTGDQGETDARLDSAALIAAGLWRQDDSDRTPTHIITAPGEKADRYCGEVLAEDGSARLCTFTPEASLPGVKLPFAPALIGKHVFDHVALLAGESKYLSMTCGEATVAATGRLIAPRSGPWSAKRPLLRCTAAVGDVASDERSGRMSAGSVEIVPFLGRAKDRWVVSIRGSDDLGSRFSLRTRVEVEDGEPLIFKLPNPHSHTFEIEIVPTTLPFVKVERIRMSFHDSFVDSTGGLVLSPRSLE